MHLAVISARGISWMIIQRSTAIELQGAASHSVTSCSPQKRLKSSDFLRMVLLSSGGVVFPSSGSSLYVLHTRLWIFLVVQSPRRPLTSLCSLTSLLLLCFAISRFFLQQHLPRASEVQCRLAKKVSIPRQQTPRAVYSAAISLTHIIHF